MWQQAHQLNAADASSVARREWDARTKKPRQIAGLKASDHEPVGVMHLQLFARGVRHVVEAGGRWAVMLGRLLRMLRREELVHMIERGLRQFVLGMLSGTLA